ncbi:hypothetical protein [Lysobacter sp. CA196]|uniref:hypothetical protein n=1 Tax=Lysobacter sp. CA196 TaxID=3455606 RepID=UPI003F8D86D9
MNPNTHRVYEKTRDVIGALFALNDANADVSRIEITAERPLIILHARPQRTPSAAFGFTYRRYRIFGVKRGFELAGCRVQWVEPRFGRKGGLYV